MNELKLALRVDDLDNVATIFAEGVTDGTEVVIHDKKGNKDHVRVIGDVPYGHKIAVRDIKAGEHIMKYGQSIGVADVDIKKGEYVHIHNMKYGQSIGVADVDIKKGEYVHIHNMKALRGRGDL